MKHRNTSRLSTSKQQYPAGTASAPPRMELLENRTYLSVTTYDLGSQWSNTSNPNGVWQVRAANVTLPHVSNWDGDPFTPAQPGFATSATGVPSPFWFKASSTVKLSQGIPDWKTGDIVVHTANNLAQNANVTWTSPAAGTISISGGVWEARDIERSNHWSILKNGVTLTGGDVGSGDAYSRAKPFSVTSGSGGAAKVQNITVNKGDVIELLLAQTGGTGDYVGVKLAVTETTTGASTLDPNFAAGGKLTTTINSAADTPAIDVVTDSNGKIIVATPDAGKVAVVRYLPNGALDPSFGTGGKTIISLGAGKNLTPASLALQSNGEVVIGGSYVSGLTTDAFLLRLTTTGGLDSTFGSGGIRLFKFGENDSVDVLNVLSSGKILGATSAFVADDSNLVCAELERFNSNGATDITFGTKGIGQTEGYICQYLPKSIEVQSSGKIVLASEFDGVEFEIPVVDRFNANGTLDSTFQEPLPDTTEDTFTKDMALQSDNKIVLVGAEFTIDPNSDTSDTIVPLNNFLLVRYLPNGDIDTSFNGNGVVRTTFGSGSTAAAEAVVVQPNGRIVVVGQVNGNIEAVRYQSNGALDTTFGNGGKMPITFTGGSEATGVALQSSGRIVVAGGAGSSNHVVAVARILGDHTILTNGQSMVTTGASLAADPRLAGSTIASQTLNFSFGTGASAVHGQVIESVIKESAGGTLDFYYQIVTASGSLGGISSLLASNFTGFTTYVDYRPDSTGTLAPVTASRSSDGKGLTFNFLASSSGNGLVSAGKSSYSLFIKTNAVRFSSAGKVLLNNIASLAGYQPTV